jgi:polyphosphate kinase 2 (PPK2 family)
MKRKEYEREMKRLHGELVAMQEWVKASGAKICIVFEGRDTAGKGGTIKRITERVSPRVFRVVALPAPPTVRSRRCTSSGTSRISQPPARSLSSTAAGTTGRALSG